MGTPVDGPKGPIFQVKHGMIYISQKSGVPIVPMGVAYSKKWIFNKTWDKFQLPKPFSRGVVIFGTPYNVELGADMELECLKLKKKIEELDERAEKILDNKI